MEASFWHDAWSEGRIGFHQNDINRYLQQYWPILNLEVDSEVLVPLCGKSLDMLWLQRQGYQVLGVELSEFALKEFVAENNLHSEPIDHAPFCGYQLPEMTLLCGDFFHLNRKTCQEVKAVYDRAALVAFPFEMRKKYAMHLKSILPQETQMLLVALAYDPAKLTGPPFSVEENEVHQLYGKHFNITSLISKKFQRKGVDVTETAYLLAPKD